MKVADAIKQQAALAAKIAKGDATAEERATFDRVNAALAAPADVASVVTQLDTMDKHAPSLRDCFGRRQHLELGIPCGENGHRLLKVDPSLAESVIRAHIANKEAELKQAVNWSGAAAKVRDAGLLR